MCCFSRSVRHVSSTRIFARPLEGDRQLLVYGMTLEVAEDVAMILPIPVPPGAPEDAVRFVDLSACPAFFDELEVLFPSVAVPGPAFGAASRAFAPQAKLVVHDVGDFEASFVPTPRDFDRLDARFRLPSEVWEQLPRYADWGFCVFKLKATKGSGSGLFGLFKSKGPGETKTIHPMAFEFPRRDPTTLFFPTVHVHDGEVHPTAEFDHELYCQLGAAWEPLMDWPRSAHRSEMLIGARAWVDPTGWFYRRTLKGEHPNRDTWLSETRLRGRTALSLHFRVRMCAAWEHVIDDGKIELDSRVKKWMRVSEAERVRIKDAVVAQLAPVFAANVEAWGLTRFEHDLVDASPTGLPELPFATLPMGTQHGIEQRGCLVRFTAQNERLEPQQVDVAFRRIPSSDVRSAVRAIVQAAFDEASGA